MGGNPQVPKLRLVSENTFVETPLNNEALVMLDCLVMKGREIIPTLCRHNMDKQRQEMASTMLSFFLKRMKQHPDDWADLIKEAAQCNG